MDLEQLSDSITIDPPSLNENTPLETVREGCELTLSEEVVQTHPKIHRTKTNPS